MSASMTNTHTLTSPASTAAIELTAEELALLRASVAFHARCVTDPALRTRLEGAASKLGAILYRGTARAA